MKKSSKGDKATIGSIWTDLTKMDRAVLLMLVNAESPINVDDGTPEVHMGTLPFVTISRAQRVLKRSITGKEWKAFHLKLLKKLGGVSVDTSKTMQIGMTLRHKKVVKRFGDAKGRGLRIPFTQAFLTTAGLKWSLPKRSYVPDNEAKVFPMFNLKFVAKLDKDWSQYIIECPKEHSNELKNFLHRVCR